MPTSTIRAAPRRNPPRTVRVSRQNNLVKTAPMGANIATGLTTLPLELHLDILSHLSCTPVPCVSRDTLDMRERFDSIFALSKTCTALRRVYHPLLWSNLDARGWRRVPRKRESVAQVVDEDVRLCAKVLRAPDLAELVQVFNVGLSEHSPEIVYKELARCCTTSQVHTLTLPAAFSFYPDKEIFPSLRHMGIHEIGSRTNEFFPELRVTPRLRIILPTSDGSLQEAENALKRMQNGWKRVHTLQLDEQLLVHAEVEPELIQRILAIAKEVLRRNLALDINKESG
ncbi:hypothetical protein CPB85DRAFT_1353625, partial [Mucidula mucida]